MSYAGNYLIALVRLILVVNCVMLVKVSFKEYLRIVNSSNQENELYCKNSYILSYF